MPSHFIGGHMGDPVQIVITKNNDGTYKISEMSKTVTQNTVDQATPKATLQIVKDIMARLVPV